jgi:hypothetical protein
MTFTYLHQNKTIKRPGNNVERLTHIPANRYWHDKTTFLFYLSANLVMVKMRLSQWKRFYSALEQVYLSWKMTSYVNKTFKRRGGHLNF